MSSFPACGSSADLTRACSRLWALLRTVPWLSFSRKQTLPGACAPDDGRSVRAKSSMHAYCTLYSCDICWHPIATSHGQAQDQRGGEGDFATAGGWQGECPQNWKPLSHRASQASCSQATQREMSPASFLPVLLPLLPNLANPSFWLLQV